VHAATVGWFPLLMALMWLPMALMWLPMAGLFYQRARAAAPGARPVAAPVVIEHHRYMRAGSLQNAIALVAIRPLSCTIASVVSWAEHHRSAAFAARRYVQYNEQNTQVFARYCGEAPMQRGQGPLSEQRACSNLATLIELAVTPLDILQRTSR
jgi:hypothetical protein